MVKRKAYILGAGVSGLVSGWKLLEKGWDVEIIEKEPFYGGMSRSWKWRDFILDVGPHIYHTTDDLLIEFWEREFGDLFVKGDFWCKNVKGENFDQYYDYPLSYESIAQLPPDTKQKILEELEKANPEEKARAQNFKEYIRAMVGPTIQEMFFENYPRKIWGLSTEEMTPNWAPKRIELRQNISPFYQGQWSAVGKYGTGCVYDRIYEDILKLGGKVRLGQGLKALTYKKNIISELILDGDEILTISPNDVVISTIPIGLMCRFLGIPSNLKFRGVITAYLAINQEYVLPEGLHWLYYDHPDIIFHRISEQKKFSPDTAVPGKTCISAEISYSRGDDLDQCSDEEIVNRVLKDAIHVGLISKDDYIDGCMNRQPAVYPLQHRDYQHELAQIQSQLGEYRQLYCIGTTGEFNYADSQILFLKAFDLVDLLTDQYSEFSQTKRREYVAQLNPVVTLNTTPVGDGHRPYIIAEAGLNHNGSLELAYKTVDQAIEAGCNAIKFQTYTSANRISGKVKTVRYAETTLGEQETLLEMFERLEFDHKAHQDLFQYAQQKGIEVFSTPFDLDSVDLLESLGVNLYKIASFDIVNLPLLRKVAQTNKPVIVSTGMSTLGQIEEAIETIRSEGNGNIILLHCVSAYPVAPENLNLRAIETLKRNFNIPVGLSDHSLGLMASQTALALGANIIERHFTLDRTMEGPDHILSSEPEEMRALVRYAGLINQMLGDGIKKIEACEYNMINTQRKSLYVNQDISKGDIITRDKIAIKGPGVGLHPRYLDVVIGRQARQDLEADYPITWDTV